MKKTELYFARIDNDLIRTNQIDKKVLLTYIYLDRRKNIEHMVGFSLYDLVSSNGYKINRTKTGAVTGFKKSIKFLIDNEMILLKKPEMLKGNNYLYIELLDNWNVVKNYTRINAKEIDTLMISESKIEKSNLFAVYLYIKSFMHTRNLTDNDDEFPDAKDKPIAFWGCIDTIQYDLNISKETINKCLKEYVDLKLLVKKETGSYITNENGKQIQKNAPNIYVVNDKNARQEIKWALEKLKNIYDVNEFLEFRKRKKFDILINKN